MREYSFIFSKNMAKIIFQKFDMKVNFESTVDCKQGKLKLKLNRGILCKKHIHTRKQHQQTLQKLKLLPALKICCLEESNCNILCIHSPSNHQTMVEMQKVYLFLLPHEPGISAAAPRWRHASRDVEIGPCYRAKSLSNLLLSPVCQGFL